MLKAVLSLRDKASSARALQVKTKDYPRMSYCNKKGLYGF